MAKKKDVTNFSSEELFEMAKLRAQEEKEMQKQELRSQVADLKAERKEILARHKRELAEIDGRIRGLTGRRGRGAGSKGTQTGISGVVLDLLANTKKADTKQIRAELEAQGINTANLAQTLAYLKRTGRVTSPARGEYSLA